MSENKHTAEEPKINTKEGLKKGAKPVGSCSPVMTRRQGSPGSSPKAGKKSGEKCGMKHIVSRVMSWNNKSHVVEAPPLYKKGVDLVANMEALKLSQDDSDDNLCKSDWLKARDSLENLLINREKGTSDVINSRSVTTSFNKGKRFGETSESFLRKNKNASAHSISKVLAWDPWDKLGRKNKRDSKRRKDKNASTSKNPSPPADDKRNDVATGDEKKATPQDPETAATEEYYENYDYKPYQPRNAKSVDFTNEVKVVYFNAEEIVGEDKEPLKKELDQQIRNKEMRKGHCPAMLISRRKSDDYMSSWFRK